MVGPSRSLATHLLVAGGILVNVFSGETYPADILCHGALVAAVGPPGTLTDVGPNGSMVLDASGCYVLPGLINGHLHVESTLVTPPVYGHAALARGTMTLVADPHEIANVLGLAGVRALMDLATASPADFFWTAPSCVPASPHETSGAELGLSEIQELLADPRVVALGEMMNYPGVVAGDAAILAKLAAARAAGKPADGHAPGLLGRELDRYVASGVRSDHEAITAAEAREKLRRGMWVMVREGSAARNLTDLLPLALLTRGERMMLVTDDRHPDDLLARGELDESLRLAVAGGLDPVAAVRMATLNPATYFGLQDRGLVAPGRLADLWLVTDLESFATRAVVRRGRQWQAGAEAGDEGAEPELPPGSQLLTNSVHLPSDLRTQLHWSPRSGRARVIGALPDQIVTQALVRQVAIDSAGCAASPEGDVARLAVVERHGRSGGVGLGLVAGFGLQKGAIGSTVAHDSHNIVLVGTTEVEMATAAAALRDAGGGFVVVENGQVTAQLALPVAGLMSNVSLTALVRGMSGLNEAIVRLGCRLPSPLMTLSFLALPVIPELKLTDRGLVDVRRFGHVDVWL